VLDADLAGVDSLTDEVVAHINVLAPIVENQILAQSIADLLSMRLS
jgi:hypothetical protein